MSSAAQITNAACIAEVSGLVEGPTASCWPGRQPFVWGDSFRLAGRWMSNLPRTFSQPRHGRRWIRRSYSSCSVPPEWIPPLRHGRQCLAMDKRLVSPRLLRATRCDGRHRTKSSRAQFILRSRLNRISLRKFHAGDRFSAPINTVRATSWALEAKVRSALVRTILDFVA